MKSHTILNAVCAQAQLQVAEVGDVSSHRRGLPQVEEAIPQLHFLVYLCKMRFERIKQDIELQGVEHPGAVAGVGPPPGQRVTLKVRHDKPTGGNAGP